eukprot:1211066-Alexandrium_andersonii.AAC.1
MSNTPHASALPGEHTAPEVAMDYCFLTKDGSDTFLTVLVVYGPGLHSQLGASRAVQGPPAR